MEQTSAVWLLIVLSLITANVPFVTKRPLLALPWAQAGEPGRPWLLRLLECVVFFALLYGIGLGAFNVISDTLVMSSDVGSVVGFYAKVAGVIVLAGTLLYYPGWRTRGHTIQKSFLARMLELFVLYLLCGVLAFSFEQNLGSRFAQTWEFYAITGSLYIVLGYPGFVYCYLMRRSRKPAKRKPATASRIAASDARTSANGSGGTNSAPHSAG